MRRMVVGLDGSQASSDALDLAVRLASAGHAAVHLVSVVEESAPYVAARREEQRDRLAARSFYEELQRTALTRLQRRGIAASAEIRDGNETRGVLDALAEWHGDLLVIGHAGHSGVWGVALGSTAARLAEKASSSVLVVRPGEVPLAHILVAYDGSPTARQALAVAAGLAGEAGTELTVVAPEELILARDSRVAVEAALRREAWRGPVDVRPVHGEAGPTLVRLARDVDAQLLVVGASGTRHPWSPGLGPTTRHLLEHAEVSVLVVRPPAAGATAATLMRTRLVTAGPTSALGEAARMLLESGVKCLPIVDETGHPLGILTLGDLLRRAGFGLRPGLAGALEQGEVEAAVTSLMTSARACQEIMSRDLVTADPDASVTELLGRMNSRRVKRLLVLDAEGRLAGIISRADVLRALAGGTDGRELGLRRALTGRVAADIMRHDVPTLAEDASAEAAAQAVLSADSGRVAVVDGEHRLVGVIATRDLLALATSESRPQLLEAVSGVGGRLETFLAGLRQHPEPAPRARDLMRREVVAVGSATPLAEVLQLMMARALKRVVVTDDQHTVAGVVDRADIVRALGHLG